MATLTFTVSPACAGGNHYDVTLHLGSKNLLLHMQHSDFEEELTNEEKRDWAQLLVRILVEQLTDRGVTNVRQKLAAASLTLEI